MLTEDLQALSQDLSLDYNPQYSTAYGVYKNYGVFIKANSDAGVFIVTTWARKSALTSIQPEQWFGNYISSPENSYVKSHSVQNYSVTAVIEASSDSGTNFTRLNSYIYDIIGFYSQNYFSDACDVCGSTIGVDFFSKPNGIQTRLCRMCKEKEIDKQEFVAEKQSRPQYTSPAPPPIAPMQSAYAQPEPMQSAYAQPMQSAYAQPEPMQSAYAQPMQSAYAQPEPMQSAYAQPMQSAYAQPMQSAYAQPEQMQSAYAQPMQSAYAQPEPVQPQYTNPQYTQPRREDHPITGFQDDFDAFMQGTSGAPVNQGYGNPMTEQNNMQAMYVSPIAQSGNNAIMHSQDGMDAIDPNTAPESTGFSTAESLAELQPPTEREQLPPPIMVENDFRAQEDNAYNPYMNNNPNSSGGLENFTTYNPNYGGVSPMPVMRGSVGYVKTNHLAALAGSLLFTLIGAVVWTLIGYMGIVSSLGAICLGFLCVIGYKIFGKTYDLIGLISGFVMVAIVVLCSEIFINCLHMYSTPNYSEVLEYIGYDSFGYTFFHFFDLLNDMDRILTAEGMASNLMASFMSDLGLSYVCALIGFFAIAVPEYRRNK